MSRFTGLVTRLVVLFALCIGMALAAGPAGAEEERPAEFTAETLIEAARAALAQGEPDDAEFILDGLKPGEGDVDAVDFLRGSIAMQRGEWQTAIERFRAMLARNPDLPRVRLDLALAYFQAGQDNRAAYHFRLALGDLDLPPIVRARALALLDQIRRRKSWSVSGSLALIPDSNINQATSAREVALFGSPGRLSDDARQTSGVGVSANVRGGYEWRLADALRFRTVAGLRTRTYADTSQFNEQFISLQAGPRFLFRKFDLRPELLTEVRLLGNDTYSRAVGFELSGNWLMAPTWRLSAALGGEDISYESFLGDGRLYSGRLGIVHALGRATLVQVDTALRREVVERDAYSWREYILGLSATRELPWGFVLAGGPSYRWRKYGAALPIFGPNARQDRTLAGWIRVSNRYIELFGFMPEITVRHERRDSNLPLYDYRRTAGEFGVVASF